MFKLEKMEKLDIPDYAWNDEKRETFNPFRIDLFSMGTKISEEIFMMHDFFNDDGFRNAYFVNVKTGERQRIIFDD